MALAFLKRLGRKRESEAAMEERTAANLSVRMQRLLNLHAEADVQPQELPKTGKAA